MAPGARCGWNCTYGILLLESEHTAKYLPKYNFKRILGLPGGESQYAHRFPTESVYPHVLRIRDIGAGLPRTGGADIPLTGMVRLCVNGEHLTRGNLQGERYGRRVPEDVDTTVFLAHRGQSFENDIGGEMTCGRAGGERRHVDIELSAENQVYVPPAVALRRGTLEYTNLSHTYFNPFSRH